jgi:hypothetical protein
MIQSRIPKVLNIKKRLKCTKDQDQGGNKRLGKLTHKERKKMGENDEGRETFGRERGSEVSLLVMLIRFI